MGQCSDAGFRLPWPSGVSLAVAALIVVRTLLEDAMLARGLPGYKAYRARVRCRLIPFMVDNVRRQMGRG